jgi:hypothetical protein
LLVFSICIFFCLCLWSVENLIALLKCIGFGLLTLYALGQCGLFCLLLYMQWVIIAIDFEALLGPYLICLCIGPSSF